MRLQSLIFFFFSVALVAAGSYIAGTVEHCCGCSGQAKWATDQRGDFSRTTRKIEKKLPSDTNVTETYIQEVLLDTKVAF